MIYEYDIVIYGAKIIIKCQKIKQKPKNLLNDKFWAEFDKIVI